MDKIFNLIECYERPYIEAVGGYEFMLARRKIFV